MITPDPKEKEIMIFTPNIVHGGGMNINEDITRVSLEMRFFT
jgi:acetylglutamate kinase